MDASRLNVVLAVDAVFPPLTGIGRYALELAHRLPNTGAIQSVRYYSFGRWLDGVDQLLIEPQSPVSRQQLTANLRVWAARQPWLVLLVYARLMPMLSRLRLSGIDDAVYHSPNYFVPDFPGATVATIHDLSYLRYPETHPKARVAYIEYELPRSLRRADFLITSSESTRQEVIQTFSWPEDRIAVVPLGVADRYRPQASPQVEAVLTHYGLTYAGYCLCVSTLEPRKKIDRLLAAYSRLPSSLRQQWPLVIVGGRGWLSDKLHADILDAQVAGWVRYLGYVHEADLPALYAGARAFCFPSIYEGFGLPVLEAMASGVPVLTSNASCLPEVANGAALLVEPDDIGAFSDHLQRLLTDDEWRSAAIERGLGNASGLTWDNCARNTASIYRRAAQLSTQ